MNDSTKPSSQFRNVRFHGKKCAVQLFVTDAVNGNYGKVGILGIYPKQTENEQVDWQKMHSMQISTESACLWIRVLMGLSVSEKAKSKSGISYLKRQQNEKYKPNEFPFFIEAEIKGVKGMVSVSSGQAITLFSELAQIATNSLDIELAELLQIQRALHGGHLGMNTIQN